MSPQSMLYDSLGIYSEVAVKVCCATALLRKLLAKNSIREFYAPG